MPRINELNDLEDIIQVDGGDKQEYIKQFDRQFNGWRRNIEKAIKLIES